MMLVFDHKAYNRAGCPENANPFWKPAEILKVDSFGICSVKFMQDGRILHGVIYSSTKPWYAVHIGEGEGEFVLDCGCGWVVYPTPDQTVSVLAEEHLRTQHIHGEIHYKELSWTTYDSQVPNR